MAEPRFIIQQPVVEGEPEGPRYSVTREVFEETYAADGFEIVGPDGDLGVPRGTFRTVDDLRGRAADLGLTVVRRARRADLEKAIAGEERRLAGGA